MAVAVAYGSALLISGWLLTRGINAGHHTQSLKSLGHEFPREPSFAGRLLLLLREPRIERRRLAHVLAVLLGAFLGYALVGPVGSLIGAGAGLAVIRARAAREAQSRRDLLDRQLGETVMSMAAAVRAGLSVRRAVSEAAERAEPPLRDELESVIHRLETGETLDSALSHLHRRLGLSDAALVVNALAVHRRAGGDLPSLLDEIARVIRERLEDRRVVRGLTVQARSSGVVLAVLPIAFVALLSGTGGDGLGAFYRTSSGASTLLAALSLQALGFMWMRRIVQRVEAP
jgi:tight adherence protein B